LIFEALSTAAMAGLAGYAYLRTKGMSSDTDKIQMIFKNAGWQGRGGETTKQAVIHAFDPLLELMVDLALPISGVILTSDALLILIGMKDKGFSLILNASLGYCIVQLSPLFISLLAEVGKAL